jgi:hypothetical protein
VNRKKDRLIVRPFIAFACRLCARLTFLMKLVFAAPDNFLPSLATALASQVSRLHFCMKLIFAAPASGLAVLSDCLALTGFLRHGRANREHRPPRSEE